MKRLYFMLVIVLFSSGAAWSQTSYGNLRQGNAGINGDITNSYFGNRAGMSNTGGANTFIGYFTGSSNTLGNNNTFLGSQSGLNNTLGNANTYLGFNSGFNNQFGSGNVFLGYQAGYNETGSNLLYIDNSNTTSPLIWGDFSLNALRFHGTVRITNIPQNNALTQILASDASGNINWRDAATLGGGTDNQQLSLIGNLLQLEDGGNVDLSPYLDDTDSQNLSIITAGTDRTINITNGLGVNFSVADNDNDATNEIQTLSYNDLTHMLSISGSNSVDLSSLSGDVGTFPSYPDSAGDGGGNTNAYFGHEAGVNNTIAERNVAMGTRALYVQSFNNGGAVYQSNNVAIGFEALYNNEPTGIDFEGLNNTAVGAQALYANTTGESNTAVGSLALDANTTGIYNTAVGRSALGNNTTGNYNTAVGRSALSANTTARYNNAFGWRTLNGNTIGESNVAIGSETLMFNTTASRNIAIGRLALFWQSFNPGGGVPWESNNIAIGYRSLEENQPTSINNGIDNIALGVETLRSNTTGYSNIAIGTQTLYSNTTGDYNTATGYEALQDNTTGFYNTAYGGSTLVSNTTGDMNTALGTFSGPNSNNYHNTTALGFGVTTTASDQVRIGDSNVTSIGGYANWTNVSDARFKKNVEQNVPGLDFIAKLKPVTYTMDVTGLNSFLGVGEPGKDRKTSDIEQQAIREKEAIRYTGFIAQEVEQAAREVGYDFSGVDKPQNERSHYGLRYAEFVVPLTKAVQELSALVETQKQENQTLRQELETLKNAVYGTKVKTAGKSSGEETQLIAEGFALYQNTPNPFNKTTVIAAQVPQGVQQADIILYNLQGVELASYPLEERGKVSVEISGGRFPSGMYLYALVADGQVIDTKKMILMD